MKFVCTKNNLLHGLQLVTGLTGKNTNLPILSHVLVHATESGVEIVSTNLEIAIKTQIRAKTEEVGQFTVPGKTLLDYVNLVREEQIEISVTGSEMMVSSGSAKTKIKGSPADDFPVIPDIEDGISYVVNKDALREGFSGVVFAASKNEIRPELSGIYFGYLPENKKITLAATDSYRLAEKQLPVLQGEEEFSCIIPGKTVTEAVRLLSFAAQNTEETQVRVTLTPHQIRIRFETFELTSRLVDGKYPDYRQIIPTQFKTTAVFPVEVMRNAIKAASIFSTTGVNAITFLLSPEQKHVTVSSTNTQSGEHVSTLDAVVDGDENTVILNFRYVLDGLLQFPDSEIEFRMNGAETPCVFQSKKDESYLYIVMPIRQ